MRDPSPFGRFDDPLAGAAVQFAGARQVCVAYRPDEVVPVLDEVDRLTRDGRWAFGFVAYEAASGLDPGLVTHPPPAELPLVWFGIADRPQAVPLVDPRGPAVPDLPWTLEWDAQTHGAAVERVRDRIAAGETYQCNLTTRLTADAPAHLDPAVLYRELVHGQRGAHHAYLDTGRFVVAGASPELFFEQRGPRVRMRPMKGTAGRGRTTAEDAAAVARLRASEKELAENLMIVDLVRNDLGRIAVPGSVRVPRLFHAERYETVHQLTSEVTAELRPEVGLTGIVRALFPCGSVTGAPKARTMELIRELEAGPRGVYCGAVGVVGPPDAEVRARFSVAIRTVLLDRATQRMVYGSGGGITWNSEAAAEYAELRAKARVLDARYREVDLLETMLHDPPRGLRHLTAHLDRMADSARYFGIPFDADAARDLLRSRLRGAARSRVRLRCHRDGTLDVDVSAAPPSPPRPVLLTVDHEPMDTLRCWSRHKTSRRDPYDERLARHRAVDDVVLVNERGEVMETCRANLAVRLEGRWWTPPLASGCLPGIERARMLDEGALAERVLLPADLHDAAGLALVSSLRGWLPARLAPHAPLARPA